MQDGWPRRRIIFVSGENGAGAWRNLVPRFRPDHLVHWVDPAAPFPDLFRNLGKLAESPLGACHVVASGSGCDLAVSFALHFPHAVTSLVLVDPASPTSHGDFLAGGQLDRLVQWLQLGHGPSVREEQHLKLLRAKVAEQTLSGWDIPAPMVTDDQLEKLACPLLVLFGGATDPSTKAVMAAKYGQAPFCQVRLVSGVVHCCLREAPEQSLAIALDFVGAMRDIA